MPVRRMIWALAILSVGFIGRTAARPASPQPLIPASSLNSFARQETQAPRRTPDVIYVPTPQPVVDAMLKVANVTKDDVVYDLGCGDGRIVVTAAKRYGARGVGIDIDPQRIREARENVEKAGVGNLVTIVEGDLFTMPLGDASVVTLYLLSSLNQKLMPKLKAELKDGTRVVSHSFDMGDAWPPEQTLDVQADSPYPHKVYFWTIHKGQHR